MMKWPFGHLAAAAKGGASAGVVIRQGAVELLALQGSKVTTRIRVPVEGKDEPYLTAAIRKAVEAANLKTKKLPVAFLTQDVLFRFFTMPAVPKAEWDTAVQFEVRKYIPFKTDTLVWDYAVLDAGASGKLEVIFAAMQRDAFESIHNALTAARVQPTLMEPRSLSLARLVESAQGTSSGEFVCVVDVDGSTAHLAIVKNGVPYLARDLVLPAATDRPADAVADASQAVDPQAQRLLSELSVSIDFFTREYPSAGIVRVWLFGDEQLIRPWCQWFSDQLRCPVDVGVALMDRLVDGGLPTSFASAVGLLKAQRGRAGSLLNFLRRSASVEKASASHRRLASPSATTMPTAASLFASARSPQMVPFGAAAIAVIIGCWLFGAGRVGAERQRLARLQQTRPSIGEGLNGRTAEDLAPIEEETQAQVAILAQILGPRVSVAAKLDALARALPDGIWLTGVSYDETFDSSGKSQPKMLVKGACFLGASAREESAMFELEERMKRQAAFLRGFGVTRLEEVHVRSDQDRQHPYGTFQLNSTSDRRL